MTSSGTEVPPSTCAALLRLPSPPDDTHEVDGAGELRPDACTQFLRRALLDLVTGEPLAELVEGHRVPSPTAG